MTVALMTEIMPTFGGLSFTNNSSISDFLNSIQAEFIDLVLCHSIFLKCYKDRNAEILNIAKHYSYPRIGLYLASAKRCDDGFLFSDLNDPGNLSLLYQNVVDIMTDPNSPFAEGITAIAAGYTAVKLIRQLPINNNFRNVEVAKDFEENYRLELDKLIELYCKTDSQQVPVISTKNISCESGNTFYLALSIDPNSLPPQVFDTGSLTDVLELDTGYVKTYDSLQIEGNHLAFAYVYLSTTNNLATVNNVGEAKEIAFKLNNGTSLERLIDLIALNINKLTLPSDGIAISNIIASPNVTQYEFKNIEKIKKNLYSEATGVYQGKKVRFNLLDRVAYLNFDARKLSATINRELLILNFLTYDKVDFISRLLGDRSINYAGYWDTNTEYKKDDLVDYLNNIYIAEFDSQSENPESSISWSIITIESKDLLLYKQYAKSHIDSLDYGLCPERRYLDSFGPKSIILDVEKGTVTESSASSTIENIQDTCLEYPPDTFYFQFGVGITSVTGWLKINLSSVDLEQYPEYKYLLDLNGNLNIYLDGVQSIAEIVLKINRVLFQVSKKSGILSAIVRSNALQIIAFKPSQYNINHIIDLVNLPAGLEIAVGNIVQVCSEYYSSPRSLILKVENKTIPQAQGEVNDLNIKEDFCLFSAVKKMEYRSANSRLPKVKDKLNRLN